MPLEAKKLDSGALAGDARPSTGWNPREPASFDVDATVDNIPVVATIDSGCTGILVSKEIAKKVNKPLRAGPAKILEFAEGSTTKVDQYATIDVGIGPTTRTLEALVAPVNSDLLLGLRWLRRENPKIDWTAGTVTIQGHTIMSKQQLRKAVRRGEVVAVATVAKGHVNDQECPPEIDARFAQVVKEYEDVFPATLPPVDTLRARAHDVRHEITIEDGARPHSQPIYHLSEAELSELRRQLKELLDAGHIQPSKSPWGALILFVKKKGSQKLRIVHRLPTPQCGHGQRCHSPGASRRDAP